MAEPSNDQSDASPPAEPVNGRPPASRASETTSFARICSILSYVIGIPMVAISGLCVATFFPSIIFAGPCFVIGGLFVISGLVLSKGSSFGFFVPLMAALAALLAFFVWLNQPGGGA